jgi:uncharacterized membrane protein
MNIRLPLIVSLLLVAAMAALSAWAWNAIPPTAQIPIHWGMNGEANGFAGRDQALLMAPLLTLGLALLFAVIPRIEPRRFNLASSAKFYRAAWVGSVCLLAAVHTAIVLNALHFAPNARQVVMPGAALLFIVIGNYLGKTRSNFFAGVRTPWTLSSDYSWEKTHRLTGRLFMLVGTAVLIVSLAADTKLAATLLVVGALSAALIGVVASYVYWRRDPARHSSDGVPE